MRLGGSPRTPRAGSVGGLPGPGPSGSGVASVSGLDVGLSGPRAGPACGHRGPNGAQRRLSRTEVHRPVDYPAHVVASGTSRAPIRCAPSSTWPPRAAPKLDAAVDRALAQRLLTVEAIEAEWIVWARRGRTGVAALRGQPQRRGLIGAPHPSVLESRTLGSSTSIGIRAPGVRGKDGARRPLPGRRPAGAGVMMEVDGFAYHCDPEQVAEDKRRRTRLRLSGIDRPRVHVARHRATTPRRVISEGGELAVRPRPEPGRGDRSARSRAAGLPPGTGPVAN